MQISLDSGTGHIITAYSSSSIKINDSLLEQSFLITPTSLHENWQVKDISSLSFEDLQSYLLPSVQTFPEDSRKDSTIELVLIGHTKVHRFPDYGLIAKLSELGIGFEFMDMGAACRTYSILNSEGRTILAGFIL